MGLKIVLKLTWVLLVTFLNVLLLFQTASSSGDPHVHIIKQVKPTDEGLYTCIAGNVLGQATASAYLEVNRGALHSSTDSCYLLFLLLLLLIAQNQLWINRLTSCSSKSRSRPLISWTIKCVMSLTFFLCCQENCVRFKQALSVSRKTTTVKISMYACEPNHEQSNIVWEIRFLLQPY